MDNQTQIIVSAAKARPVAQLPPWARVKAGLKARVEGLPLVSRFRKAQEGVAAVEFGFVATIMVTMLIGIVDISNAVSLNWRMTQLNRTLADITSQFPSMTFQDIQNVFAASAATMAPYSGPAPRMSIYSVVVNQAGVATVCWGSHSAAHSVLGWSGGSPVTFPEPAMAVPNSSYIVTAVDLGYQGFITPNFDMSSRALYFRPRQGVRLGPRNIEQVGAVQNDANRTVYGC